MAKATKSVMRTAEIARKREHRRRRLFMLVFVGAISALAIFAAYTYWFRESSFVQIDNLTVRGVPTDTDEGKQIMNAVEVATGEMTTLDLKPELLDEELARFPRVAGSEISASFPKSATVTVTLRDNGSVFGTGNDALLIATDGAVLGTAGEGTESLPEITTGDPPEGGQVEGRTLNQALVLGAVPDKLREHVDKSGYGKQGVEVTMSNGLVLLFGDASKADQKWRAAAAVIADPNLSDVSYVDLTVPRRPAASGSETEVPDPEAVPETPAETIPEG